jgi:hypothetical protein
MAVAELPAPLKTSDWFLEFLGSPHENWQTVLWESAPRPNILENLLNLFNFFKALNVDKYGARRVSTIKSFQVQSAECTIEWVFSRAESAIMICKVLAGGKMKVDGDFSGAAKALVDNRVHPCVVISSEVPCCGATTVKLTLKRVGECKCPM